ncbi:MAG: LLM class flavin-dependent oxidoreductase [Propionibacteriaceae bacterium]|jgi:alkanesulfonate monooxygenase SsuD/methylene tetrahydromethanopterin reductase-like flavin-dependent oxidoreductase (luciferase family)/predicted kinase
MTDARLPDPAVVVLAGAPGSGKSTWAAGRFRTAEVVSSDALRAAVGSGPSDLDASIEAFALLDQIVAARTKRSLMTVIDTLGLDPIRRTDYLHVARTAGLPAVLVIMNTAAALCRERNRLRDRPVPAPVLTEQLRRISKLVEDADEEGWDRVLIVDQDNPASAATEETPPDRDHGLATGPRVVLQVSRFPWGEGDPGSWLRDLALRANEIGFDGLALMDHLIQIPQVDRAWEPIPEPWVTLGMIAGLDTDLRLGTLVSPVTFREPGIIAKTVATLDVLSNGRAFCGIGAGWWLREHQAYGLDFPNDRARLDQLQVCIETLRALWAPGTKAYHGAYVHLPETTCYPRPISEVPIIVGGSGERRTLRIVAEQADGCNLPSDQTVLESKIDILHRHCAEVGRDPASVEITVLDLPVIGINRDDVAVRVERLRGRLPAAAYAARHHAAAAADHVQRYLQLADLGVRTIFVALPDLAGADDLARCAPLLAALR